MSLKLASKQDETQGLYYTRQNEFILHLGGAK